MQRRVGRTGSIAAALACALLAAPVAAHAADPVAVIAADVACGSDTAPGTDCVYGRTADTAAAQNPTVVLTAGDLQYEKGQYRNFKAYYDPTWGRLKSVTRPVPGNHDYQTSGAAGYFDYFDGKGSATGPAGDRSKGFYSFDVGNWHIVALNSNCGAVGCTAGSPQEQWLRADLAANTKPCTLAYFHHPRWSSDYYNLNTTSVGPFWNDLYAAGADLVFNGHAHDYERFAPQDPSGRMDSARGLTEVVVGTGGRSEVAFTATPNINSLVRKTGTYGVMRLELGNGYYNGAFVPISGQSWSDSFAGQCHRASGSSSPPPPTTTTTTTAPPPAPTTNVLTVSAAEDTYVDERYPNTVLGAETTTIYDGSPLRNAFLKFDVSGIGSARVSKVVLRLKAENGSVYGGTIQPVPSTSWSETTMTWANQPAASSTVLARMGATSYGSTYDVDVTGLVTRDGPVALRISSTNADGGGYYSKEGGAPAKLIITTTSG